MPIHRKVSTNSIYAGKHWTFRKQLADEYHLAMMPFRELEAKSYPVSVRYDFSFGKQPMDTTNCAFLAKLLEDGMVKWGIIAGDSPEFVGSTTITSGKGFRDWVDITITKL